MSINEPLASWLQSTIFLFKLDTVQKAYSESYKLLPVNCEGYINDIYHSLDLLLCMHPYRDLQYGPKGSRKKALLRKRMKLAWIAYNMHASQKLLDNWSQLKEDLWKWYNNIGYQYIRDEKDFESFIEFLHGYLQTTIAELAVLYVYLHLNKPVMPLGFMQHLITLGPSGPTLGDFIDIETLTFIEVKSRRSRQYLSDLLSLTINTKLPSAIAIPRYKANIEQKSIDKNTIVVEFYTLSMAGKREKPWIEHRENKNLEASIEDELKPLIQNISLLEDNTKDYLNSYKS